MGMGVVQYCTAEGGSGFIANPALPWLSSFDITHMAPVYDQTTGWLRDSQPGTFTYYPRFGPPYSADGGVLPPYPGDGSDYPQPVPYSVGCGMGAVDPGQFEAQYGRPEPDQTTCEQIQCGAIPQSVAGMRLIADCANAGYAGARSCADPICSPWLDRIPGCSSRSVAPSSPQVLLRSDVVAPMPSITTAVRTACDQPVTNCPSAAASWIESNPWLALGLAVAAGALVFGGTR